jgi:spermidine/putrescine-binding protein
MPGPNEIAVRRLPKLTKDGLPGAIGWVDGLAISQQAEGPIKEAALRFIDFVTSEAAYKLLLTHECMKAPGICCPRDRASKSQVRRCMQTLLPRMPVVGQEPQQI